MEMTTEEITLKPDRGPTIEFRGKLLAQTNFMTSEGEMFYDVWETPGGAYVASSMLEHGDTGNQEWRADVVEPIYHTVQHPTHEKVTVGRDGSESRIVHLGPEQTERDTGLMQRRVLDILDWRQGAKEMMRKKAGW